MLPDWAQVLYVELVYAALFRSGLVAGEGAVELRDQLAKLFDGQGIV
jgi:hypothetical protein